jgi:hypothetical protein
VLPGVGVAVAFVSKTWWATATHFDGKRTVPCPAGLQGPCVTTCPKNRPRWTAYAVVYPNRELGLRLLSWCAHSHHVSDDLAMLAGNLTGVVYHVRRTTDQHNSPLSFTRMSAGDVSRLPKALDVREYLSRLWNVVL